MSVCTLGAGDNLGSASQEHPGQARALQDPQWEPLFSQLAALYSSRGRHSPDPIFIHPSVDGHRGCSLVLAIVCSAAEKSGVCVSFWIMVFSGYMPSSGISGSDVSKYFQVIPEKCKNLNDITSNVTIIFSF